MSSAVKGARRTLMALVWLTVALVGILTTGIVTDQDNAHATPQLALDLAGGKQIILTAKSLDGSEIDASDMRQAVEIIRKRVDASGTAEAEITTQGDRNILVALPGTPSEETLRMVRESAQLQFRPVLVEQIALPPTEGVEPTTNPTPTASPDTLGSGEVSPSPSASALGNGGEASEVANVVTAPSATTAATPSPTPTPSADPAEAPAVEPTNASDPAWITAELVAEFNSLDCGPESGNLAGVALGDPNAGFVTCSEDGLYKYILGPVELSGTDIDTATAGPELNNLGNVVPGKYAVQLSFTGGGSSTFADVTERLSNLPEGQNKFGILLDGVVLSAPRVENPIIGGKASISGDFTRTSAQQLANQLKFGALPLTLEPQQEQTIQATKGAAELRAGLTAGLIGLGLVVIYTLFQYRALGLVTIGSLVIAGVLTYVTITLLSWLLGYRLSLAGVAGLIVAIGITADSFIVYFERVKDELREGRSLVAAVNHAWPRARRTILASDAVSFLAALVLYMLAVGGVRGFAFTLGLTTIIDLVVVIMFTHPILALLAKTKFFGEGHKWSGLDPRQLGRDTLYKGRGRALEPSGAPTQGAAHPLTLAERKAQRALGTVVEEKK